MTEKIKKNKKTLTGIGLGFMAFTGVWSFGNICNGFGYFNGTQAIVPWFCVFILYFLPYSLIVGELGSVFKDTDGGVSAWVFKTIGPKVAYFAGWIYWVVHMPYLSQKSNNVVVSLNWIVQQNGSISDMSVYVVQGACLVIFLFGLFLSFFGVSILKTIAKFAGMAVFVMMILYIVLIFCAPAINGSGTSQLRNFDFFRDGIAPTDWTCLLNMSILVFAVGGCEKISPYVKSMKNPGKGFPRGMIVLVCMVLMTTFLGTIAMNVMYDGQNLSSDFLTNGQYDAFVKLGNYLGIGNSLMFLYAASNAMATFATIIISIDAPLRMLLGNSDTKFIPKWLFKKNKHNTYTHGIIVVGIIVSVIILFPCIGIDGVDQMVKWFIKLNSVCMPIRYIFVFLAYIALKKNIEKFNNEDYVFIKNKKFGMFVGGWCLGITVVTCILGMYSEDIFEFVLNVCMPIILCGIGLIMPRIAKRQNAKLQNLD